MSRSPLNRRYHVCFKCGRTRGKCVCRVFYGPASAARDEAQRRRFREARGA